MEKSSKKPVVKKFYWAVFKDNEILFGGTFTACWSYLVDNYAKYTMQNLTNRGMRIARTN